MASVSDLKLALDAERQAAAKAAEVAISSIDTLLNLSTWVLSSIGVLLAILSITGVIVLVRLAKNSAVHVANKRLDNYIGTEEFKDLVEGKISDAIEERWQRTVVLTRLETHENDPAGGREFPSPNKGGRDDSK